MASGDDNWFNYDKWSANTVLTLVNVPWGNDYKDIPGFATRADLDAYIDGRVNTNITRFPFTKFNRDVKIDTPINAAMRFNYLRAANPAMPVPGDVQRNWYYFVTGYEYISPRATRLTLQLDVWASWMFDVQFGVCNVERGHIGIANTNQFQQYGRSYLTVPEGLDTGAEFRIVHKERTQVMEALGIDDAGSGYDILVCSTLDLTQDPGTQEDPSLDTATGGNWNALPSGADFYIFPTGRDLEKFFTAYTTKPWITQSIVSITLIPNMTRYNPGYDYGTNLGTGDGTGTTWRMYKATNPAYGIPPKPKKVANLAGWRNADFIAHILGSQYAQLNKFFTYPYMVIEMSAHNGSPVLLRPESWQDPDATVQEVAAFIPPGQRVVMYPSRYNADDETLSSTQTDNLAVPGDPTALIDDNGDGFDIAVVMDNFPTLPIVNNMGIAYLAQNRNGIAFSFQNATWGKTRAIAGAQAGADVANSQIGNTARQSAIANQNAAQQASISSNAQMTSGIVSAATGVGGDLTSGALGRAHGVPMGGVKGAGIAGAMGASGALGSILNSGISASAGLESANANIGARGASAVSDIQTAGQVRDTNQGFANYAAQGDALNAERGIIANIQDAQLTQPSVSGQFGGDAFNLVQGLAGYVLTWKMPNLQVLRQIGNFWLRYGYGVQQYLTPPVGLHCMTKFTYWKMTEAQLLPVPIPEGFKQIIRGIFQSGTTIWKNPDDIPSLPLADNAPLPGISY